MYKEQGQYRYSPSDLTLYMESPFASWMERFVKEHKGVIPEKDPGDAFMEYLSQKGDEHEKKLELDFVDKGFSLITIEKNKDNSYTDTLDAMKLGVDVIAQARLELEPFGGYADFLVKAPNKPSVLGNWHYEVWDAKLANQLKPIYVIQLCCYAQMLESMQEYRPEFVTVALGCGTNERLRTVDYFYYYLKLKSSFLIDQDSFNINSMPDPVDSKSWGNWSNFAEKTIIEKDHLRQVANITKGQIKKLNQSGVKTMQELVSFKNQVSGINPLVMQKLKAQASIQKLSSDCDSPKFEIIKTSTNEKVGFELLPPDSPMDVFFDIEGFPLDNGGLEYLWGNTYFDEKRGRQYIDFWAHNKEQEKKCFQDFICWVYQRWQQDPMMHIYHYGHYEITACRKLMGRYGICEHELDQLLRNEVFVDLYKIFKGGVRLGVPVGMPSYSIKHVEYLYRNKRETKVGDGGVSVAEYGRWRELNQLGEQGDTYQTSEILNDIRKYNIDDCDSTQELLDWLRKQQAKHGFIYNGQVEVNDPDLTEEVTERTKLRDSLLTRSKHEKDKEKSVLTENLAWVLEFHRREDKPIWWRLFERLGLSHIELIDDPNCLANCQRTSQEAFKPTQRARNLAYEYRFDSTQEFKEAHKYYFLLGVKLKNGNKAKVTFLRDESNLEKGLIVLQSNEEPPSLISLIPDEYVNPNPIPQAIDQIVSDYAKGELIFGESAILDFLTRSKPRIKGLREGAIAPSQNPEEKLQQIIHAISNLENSYLTIQGPPGAGKSYTGKHVIAQLMKSGKRVGIASNSHKAINNLLLMTAKLCKEEGISATFACAKNTDSGLSDYDVAITQNANLINHIQPASVIGSTAWGFSRDDLANQLDYLFVDEAGQVAVANLIAMSRSSTNLILMGDQMQLGQPSEAVHPGESGLSVLDYLLHKTPIISEEMGVFLATTYRMHSCVNQFISEHIYEGKLQSAPKNDDRIIEVPRDYVGPLDKKAGIVFVPVEHEGREQASQEEVEEIKVLAHSLIGRTLHTGKSNLDTRTIDWNDILFVAPYNYQVSKLRSALGDKAKIGSVDKFQGQEAPIVFLSMCASDARENARGLNFLLEKNRINVAISRAQSLAVVVGNPNIGKTPVSNISQLKLVNLFNALTKNFPN